MATYGKDRIKAYYDYQSGITPKTSDYFKQGWNKYQTITYGNGNQKRVIMGNLMEENKEVELSPDEKADVLYSSILRAADSVINEHKDVGDMGVLTFATGNYTLASVKRDDGNWRSLKIPSDCLLVLENVRMGSKDIIFTFYSNQSLGDTNYCEITRKEAEKNIKGFAEAMMVLMGNSGTMAEILGNLKPKGNVTLEKKAKKVKAEKPRPERGEMFGSW